MKKKIRVAVLFGGRSGEHEVSLRSAASVIAAIDKDKYDVTPIAIGKSGKWLSAKDSVRLLPSGAAAEPSGARALTILPQPGSADAVDVVFPVLHGTFGEDGTVQGLLELAGVAYVGAGVLGSAVAMDKDVMKRLFRERGLPTPDHVALLRSHLEGSRERLLRSLGKRFGYPMFVKPANLGSSVGITKAHDRKELQAGLELAAQFDRKIIVERFIEGRELECSVLGNDRPEASLAGEVLPSREFYDYEAKYIDETSRLIIPARLARAQMRRVQKLAVEAFLACECSGMARVDFFLEKKTGHVLINELNTIPGFTSISMYPKLWEASGLAYPGLIDRLIQLALERHAEKTGTRYSI
ncbi:MAG TPA: D-alanine--D-alanine ligase family protein [Bryobacterales bacterium]|nr:D-alanine--D-alanine ligase family protein [Bryobacterales bacterium]